MERDQMTTAGIVGCGFVDCCRRNGADWACVHAGTLLAPFHELNVAFCGIEERI